MLDDIHFCIILVEFYGAVSALTSPRCNFCVHCLSYLIPAYKAADVFACYFVDCFIFILIYYA